MALWYFLAYLTCSSWLVAGQSLQYGLRGGEVSLGVRPKLAGHPDDILWKHKGNKVVEFDGQEEDDFGRYKGRVTLNWVSGELTINDVQFEDSGDYELEAFVNKMLTRQNVNLTVMDRVATPTVSCALDESNSSDKKGALVCSSQSTRPQSLLAIEWSSDAKVMPGSQLLIPLGENHDDKVYTCRVSNPLTEESATFTAKDCYPDDGPPVALISSLVVFFTIIPLLAVLYCKLKRKACFAKGDVENQPARGRTNGTESKPLLYRNSTLPSNQPLVQPIRTPSKREDPHSDLDNGRDEAHSDTEEPTESFQDKVRKFESSFKGQISPGCPKANAAKEKRSVVDISKTSPPAVHPRSPPTNSTPNVSPPDAKEDPGGPSQSVSDNESMDKEQNLSSVALDKMKSSTPTKPDNMNNTDVILRSPDPVHTDSDGASEGDVAEPPQEGSEMSIREQESNVTPEETHTKEENRNETGKPVSGDENGSESWSENDNEDLYSSLARSGQSWSSTPTKPDNRNTGVDEGADEAEVTQPAAAIAEPQQEGSEMLTKEQESNLSPGDSYTEEDNRQETDEPAPGDENGSESGAHGEEKDKELNVSLVTPEQLPSSTPTKPDNRRTESVRDKVRKFESSFKGQISPGVDEEAEVTQPAAAIAEPQQDGSEMLTKEQESDLSPGDTRTEEDNRQETDEPAPGDENGSESGAHGEEKDKELNLPLAPPEQLQSSTPTKPDNRNTGVDEEANEAEVTQPAAAIAEPQQEGLEMSTKEQESNPSPGDTRTEEDNRQETDEPAPGDENGSESGAHGEEKDKELNVSSVPPEQLQSSTPTEPDNRNTDIIRSSPEDCS